MNKRVLLPLAGVCLLASASLALIDTNGNGVSDLWEKQHNNDQLFPETFDPQTDSDGDGWTNAEEAAAGTDPLDANPPTGFLRPDILHTPAVTGDPDEDGIPDILSPEALTISWTTLPGKQYTLQYSPDLGIGSWLTVDSPFIGNGNISEFHFLTENSDKCFWRVAVEDADTDGDGLTDAEEHTLGTNSNSHDTDSDGLADGQEIELGTDPTNDDTDGDSLADGTDADPKEFLIDWEATPNAAYILIDIPAPSGQIARDINENGEVLFDEGISSGGEWIPKQLENPIAGVFPRDPGVMGETIFESNLEGWTSFNRDHQLVGRSTCLSSFLPDPGSGLGGGDSSFYSFLSWSQPEPTYCEEMAAHLPASIRRTAGSFTPLGIAADGKTAAIISYVEDIDPSPDTENLKDRSRLVIFPADGSAPQIIAPADDFLLQHNHMPDAKVSPSGWIACQSQKIDDSPSEPGILTRISLWNPAHSLVSLPAGTMEDYQYRINLTELPNGRICLTGVSGQNAAGTVLMENASHQMNLCNSLSAHGIQFFAGDGTAMTNDHRLWRNGKLIPLRDLCQRFGELLDAGWSFQPLKANKHGSYLIQADGPNGEKEAKIVVPVEVRDEQFATGVDDVSRRAKPNDPGYHEDFWIMAPSGEIPGTTEPRKNETRFRIPHESATHLRITPAATDATVTTPNPFPLVASAPDELAKWPAVTWHGVSSTTKDAEIDWHIGSPDHWNSAELPVKVKVMKGRTVRVAVWLVPCKTKDGNRSDPSSKPTKAELEQYLNGVFKPQINVSFDCVVTETDVLDFDVVNGTGFGAPASAVTPHNGILDTNNNGVAEFKTLRDNHYDDEVDINIYIVGQYLFGIRSWVWLTSQNRLASSVGLAVGLTNRGERCAVITTNVMTSTGNMDGLKDTVAHEIGHVIIGPGHPDKITIKPDGQVSWENAGVAPLHGVDPANRLMCGGLTRNDENATLIVKKEWDEAEGWLDKVSDVRYRKEKDLPADAPTGNY